MKKVYVFIIFMVCCFAGIGCDKVGEVTNYYEDDKMVGIFNQETNKIEAVRKSVIRAVLEKKRHLLSKPEGKIARRAAAKKGR